MRVSRPRVMSACLERLRGRYVPEDEDRDRVQPARELPCGEQPEARAQDCAEQDRAPPLGRMLREVVVDVVSAEHHEPDERCLRGRAGPAAAAAGRCADSTISAGSLRSTKAIVDASVTGGARSRDRRSSLAGEFREEQADAERRDHEHEQGPGRRQDECGDVEVADHRLTRSEHDAADDPGHERREDREAEQLQSQVKGERLTPPETKVAQVRASSHSLIQRSIAKTRTRGAEQIVQFTWRAAPRPCPTASGGCC